MKKLANNVAVITGASKGIGTSIAKHLAAAGASVVVNYSSAKDAADKIVAEITAMAGKQSLCREMYPAKQTLPVYSQKQKKLSAR